MNIHVYILKYNYLFWLITVVPFIYGEGRSNFSTHVIEEGHEMNNIEDVMTILHKESNRAKINKLEEIEIIKAAASFNILNNIINGRNDPLYKILISVDN